MKNKFYINNLLTFLRERGFIVFAMVGVLTLAACSSDTPAVYPDGSDEIRMSVGMGVSTRTAGYRAWSADTDPTTMGVIAFTNGTPTAPYIYNNASFSAPKEGTVWTTASMAYWHNYADATALDFFAYMPHMPGATVTNSGNTYALTLTNVPGVSNESYLVASAPVHYASALGNITPVPMQMDQLMTSFEFQFALGTAMAGLRTFRIKKVQMSHIVTSATVTQTYTINSGSWIKGETTISPASDHTASAEVSGDITVGYANVSKTDFVSFPKMLYTLPFDLTQNTPKITVTYDVYDQEGYWTRTATSEIDLNADNFGTLNTVQAAHKNVIKIKIVPDELHKLSDADQSTVGYLVVGE